MNFAVLDWQQLRMSKVFFCRRVTVLSNELFQAFKFLRVIIQKSQIIEETWQLDDTGCSFQNTFILRKAGVANFA